MGNIGQISSHLLNRTINIQQRTTVTDETGDFTETWVNVVTGIKASILPYYYRKDTEYRKFEQGREFKTTHRGYINVTDVAEIINGQRIYDTVSGIYYDITSANKWGCVRTDNTDYAYHELFLEIVRDNKT